MKISSLKFSDILPVVGWIGTWMASHVDWLLTRGVGFATLVFTVLKIIHLVKHWNDKPKADE